MCFFPLRFDEWRDHELGVRHEEKRCNTDDLKFETSLITTYITPTTRQKKFGSAKGPCPNMDLTSMSWRILLSEPGSDLHQPNRPFCPNGPRPLGLKWPKFVRFCLKHLWELSGVLQESRLHFTVTPWPFLSLSVQSFPEDPLASSFFTSTSLSLLGSPFSNPMNLRG